MGWEIFMCTYVYLVFSCWVTLNIVFLCIFLCIVPTPRVQITITDYQTFVDYETSGDASSGESEDKIFANVTIGDPLTLDCTVTTNRRISSSVDIIWTTGGRVVRRVDNITADIVNDSAIYTDSFEISSLSAIDNGREYQCTVVTNVTRPIHNSDQITLNFLGKYVAITIDTISYGHRIGNDHRLCSYYAYPAFDCHLRMSINVTHYNLGKCSGTCFARKMLENTWCIFGWFLVVLFC